MTVICNKRLLTYLLRHSVHTLYIMMCCVYC